MNAVTSGPTPTPAAATVAAYSTSRLMPSRCVSLPASRMTYRSGTSATVTRKLRFVIPPLSAVSVRSRPASSGIRCIAPTRWSRSSPWSSAGSVASSVIRSGAAHAAPQLLLPGRFNSTDRRLTGDEVGRLGVLGASADADEVVDRAKHDQDADERLEDRPGRHPIDGVAERLDEPVDGRIGDRPAVATEVPEEVRVLPDGDVQQHQAAVDDGQDVDRLAPPAEVEPCRLVRPPAEAGVQHAEVRQQVAEVDQARGRDRHAEPAERADHEDRDGGQDADGDRGIGRRLERAVDASPKGAA